MKDFLLKDLAVGDKVILNQPGYKNLVKGIIVKLTEKQVYVEFFNTSYNKLDYTYLYPRQVVKYEN